VDIIEAAERGLSGRGLGDERVSIDRRGPKIRIAFCVIAIPASQSRWDVNF
jgi:hypothetical protein